MTAQVTDVLLVQISGSALETISECQSSDGKPAALGSPQGKGNPDCCFMDLKHLPPDIAACDPHVKGWSQLKKQNLLIQPSHRYQCLRSWKISSRSEQWKNHGGQLTPC